MNNLDLCILIVVAISALIALNRGLIKEVLSIIGWVLSVVVIVFMLPIVKPLVLTRVEDETMAIVASSLLIFVIFFILWIIITSGIIDKIRSSKLSSLDRILGLFFGVVRACILVILFNIMVGWIIPADEQPEVFKESKYFQLAGSFAEPIEKLLPKDIISKDIEKEDQEKKEQKKEQKDKKEAKEQKVISEDMDKLFDKLVQPKVEKKSDKDKDSKEKSSAGYNKTEQNSLDRLIEMNVE
ncbi:MAG: CvpA family protein [Rhodospirillales bacterium]|nr:CvpA family protein [Rhodospirillales bacterium]